MITHAALSKKRAAGGVCGEQFSAASAAMALVCPSSHAPWHQTGQQMLPRQSRWLPYPLSSPRTHVLMPGVGARARLLPEAWAANTGRGCLLGRHNHLISGEACPHVHHLTKGQRLEDNARRWAVVTEALPATRDQDHARERLPLPDSNLPLHPAAGCRLLHARSPLAESSTSADQRGVVCMLKLKKDASEHSHDQRAANIES